MDMVDFIIIFYSIMAAATMGLLYYGFRQIEQVEDAAEKVSGRAAGGPRYAGTYGKRTGATPQTAQAQTRRGLSDVRVSSLSNLSFRQRGRLKSAF